MSRAVFLFLAALLPALAGAATPVTLGVVTWVGYGPIYCAVANGSYQKYGYEVKLVNFADNSMEPAALQSGEVMASTMTYDQVILSDAKGWKLKVVMPLDYSVGGDAIVASTAIKSIRDIKGHKVAFTPAAPGEFLLGYALAREGMSEADVKPVNATPEGVVGIMAGGSADVGVTYEPSVSTLVKSGGGQRFHVLVSSREAKGIITDVLVFKEDVIAKDPKMVEGLMRGTMDGLAFMRAEPQRAAAIIAKTLDISVADLAEELPLIENPSLDHLGDIFTKSDSLPSFQAAGKMIGDILKKEGQIDATPAFEATIDPHFVTILQSGKGG
jgi:NitT/TauT family transport system substrate-binding protein